MTSTITTWRAGRKARQAARNAELDRQDREAAELLANLKPPPLFSEVAVDGACPKCHGWSFGPPADSVRLALAAGSLVGYLASRTSSIFACSTCGMLFTKG
jgi:hypothetical protein